MAAATRKPSKRPKPSQDLKEAAKGGAKEAARKGGKDVAEKDAGTRKPHGRKGKEPREKKRGKKEKKAGKEKKEKKDPTRRRFVVVGSIVVVLVCVGLLYPAGRTYYESVRTDQRSAAQLAAIEARNAEIQRQNDYLQTDEGIEDQARKDGGYVREGEEGVVITNGGSSTDRNTQLPDQVDLDRIHAPSTWYYDILDAFFFVHV